MKAILHGKDRKHFCPRKPHLWTQEPKCHGDQWPEETDSKSESRFSDSCMWRKQHNVGS